MERFSMAKNVPGDSLEALLLATRFPEQDQFDEMAEFMLKGNLKGIQCVPRQNPRHFLVPADLVVSEKEIHTDSDLNTPLLLGKGRQIPGVDELGRRPGHPGRQRKATLPSVMIPEMVVQKDRII